MDNLNLNEDKNSILGMLDELNSFIGFAKCFTGDNRYRFILTKIQNDIFLIQAEIANPVDVLYKPERISRSHIRYLERQTALIEENIKQIDHFIIPEGTKFACALHCIRTASRRAEREVLAYGRQEKVKPKNGARVRKDPIEFLSIVDLYARYFDRVACLAFVLARLDNKQYRRKEKKPSYYATRLAPTPKRANPEERREK